MREGDFTVILNLFQGLDVQLCRIFLYFKVKILSFFIRTGNLRTRDSSDASTYPGPLCPAPGVPQTPHLPASGLSLSSAAVVLPELRTCRRKLSAHRPLSSHPPESEFRGGRVCRQGPRFTKPNLDPWPVSAQATLPARCPQHPLPPPRLCPASAGPVGAAPTSPAPLPLAPAPHVSPEGFRDPSPARPGEKLGRDEACSRSHSWELGPFCAFRGLNVS